MSDENAEKRSSLIEVDINDTNTPSNIEPVSPASEEPMEVATPASGDKSAETSPAPATTRSNRDSLAPSGSSHLRQASREASARIADNNGEPPPIDKKTLLGLITVYFSVFLDMMGISIVQPVLPFYAEQFNADSFQLGALYSSYSLMATFAAYAMGKASDRWGRRPSILFSLFGTMIGFTVTGLATDYESLLAYRFLTGAFGGSAPIAQAYITDVVPSSQRPKYLAFTGATMALSFIIGPGIGSGLAEFDITIPFFVSGGLGGFGLIFAFFALEESHPKFRKDNAKKTDAPSGDDKLAAPVPSHAAQESTLDIQEVSPPSDKIPYQVWILAAHNVCNQIGWTSYTSMFAYYVILEFELDTLAVGYITLCLATLYVFTNVVVFSKLSRRFGIYRCCFSGLAIFCVFYSLVPLFDFSLPLTLLCIGIGAGFGNGMVFPSMSAMAADFTNPTNRGKILAFSNAAMNVGMVIGPLFHGVMFEIEPGLVFYNAGIFIFLAWCCILVLLIKNPELAKGPKNVVPAEMARNEPGLNREEDWKWNPKKPSDEDYKKLGKFLGKLLIERNYNWVPHYDFLSQYLKDIFPPVRTSSLKEHLEDIQYMRSNVSNLRNDFDSIRGTTNVTYA